MAINPAVPIVQDFELTTDWQNIYTCSSPVSRVVLEAAAFTSISASNVTYSIRIVQSGTPGDKDLMINDRTIRAKQTDLGVAIIGHAVQNGGIIQAKASANSSVFAHMAATEIT